MSIRVQIDTEAQVQRLIRLAQEEIYSLTGQLVIAIRRSGEDGGSRRSRAQKAIDAIPEQIEALEATRTALIESLKE